MNRLPSPLFRVAVWMKRPLSCKLRHHVRDYSEWGFGGNMVDFFCKRCQMPIGSMPIDEIPTELRSRITSLWQSDPPPGV